MDSSDAKIQRVRAAIEHREAAAQIAAELAKTVKQYDWSAVAPQYDKVLERLVMSSGIGE